MVLLDWLNKTEGNQQLSNQLENLQNQFEIVVE